MSMIRLKTKEGDIYVRRETVAYVTPQFEGYRLYVGMVGVSSGLDLGFATPVECETALAELTK